MSIMAVRFRSEALIFRLYYQMRSLSENRHDNTIDIEIKQWPGSGKIASYKQSLKTSSIWKIYWKHQDSCHNAKKTWYFLK